MIKRTKGEPIMNRQRSEHALLLAAELIAAGLTDDTDAIWAAAEASPNWSDDLFFDTCNILLG